MAKELVWSPSAESDLSQILEYLHNHWGEEIVDGYLDIILSLLDQISEKPNLYPLISKEYSIRKCVVTKHNSLYYRNSQSEIHILRIFDTRQNPVKLTFE